ncbi:CatB-related O-acetyltransferase [Campylobacter jejuni]|nr:CatB-related O-acetyltransferase [Campylobacter jejuni]
MNSKICSETIVLNQYALEYLKQNNIYTAYCMKDYRLKIGDIIEIPNNNDFMEEYSTFYHGNSLYKMGSHSYSFNNFPFFVKVGRYCSLAANISFFSYQHPLDLITSSSCLYYNEDYGHFHDSNIALSNGQFTPYREIHNHFPHNNKSLIIGNDVWIGTEVLIKQGIKLGHGCVIGQRAVVTKDIPPYAVVVGNPGRIIKYRFDEKTIKRLLSLQWWNYQFSDFNKVNKEHDINYYLDSLENKIAKHKIYQFEPKKAFFSELIIRSKQNKNYHFDKNIINYSNSAKTRIQNQLSYKLGQALIINSKSVLGFLSLPFIILSIVISHKQEQKAYKFKVKKNPNLALPPLESYPDYNEALKEKECFTYKLGEEFIKASKNWYGGGVYQIYIQRCA